MKKIIALVLILTLSLFAFAACKKNTGENNDNTPTEKTYSLALAVDTTVGEDNKVSNYVVALVLDADNKIVAVRLDCVETTPAVENGAIKDVESVSSKVELGENYGGTAVPEYMAMKSGSFAKQAKAFEDAIVGKTAEEVANLDLTLVSGCTMPYSPLSFKAVIAKAFASTNKTTFKTANDFTVSAVASMSVSGGKVTTYYTATVVENSKIAATIIDCNEVEFTVTDGVATAKEYKGTKVELGENYGGTAVPEYMAMKSGSFAKQTEAFENYVTGKTASEVAGLDLTLISGCTMPYSPYSFQAVLAKAFANAR